MLVRKAAGTPFQVQRAALLIVANTRGRGEEEGGEVEGRVLPEIVAVLEVC